MGILQTGTAKGAGTTLGWGNFELGQLWAGPTLVRATLVPATLVRTTMGGTTLTCNL